MRADRFGLEVLTGDSEHFAGGVGVMLSAGPGCSGTLPSLIPPEDLVAARTAFSWPTIANLPEVDPQGRPALFHVGVYIDNKEQLRALDNLRVYWSAQPITASDRKVYEGKCGLVEHATDGRGVLVYAIMPGKLFNILRSFGADAGQAGVEPPFRFVIPIIPDDPEYMNADGSIRFEGLAYRFIESSPQKLRRNGRQPRAAKRPQTMPGALRATQDRRSPRLRQRQQSVSAPQPC